MVDEKIGAPGRQNGPRGQPGGQGLRWALIIRYFEAEKEEFGGGRWGRKTCSDVQDLSRQGRLAAAPAQEREIRIAR